MTPKSAYEIPWLRFSLTSAVPIDRYLFVSCDTNGDAVVATADTPVVGVSRNKTDTNYNNDDGAPIRQTCELARGIVMVMAGEDVVAGTAVGPDAAGKCAASGTAAIAMTSGAAGQIISVLVG
jgi:hypothetical protein